ncbi:MAG: transposase [Kiritimatiellae bacterium]|nr:transposase [Kiritimatiellia bacterium]
MNDTNSQLPIRKHLPHRPPVRVSQFTVGAAYFITICANRNHYAPAVRCAVPNAPHDETFGGLGTNRPTTAPRFATVGRVVPNAPLTSGNTAIQLLLALENYRAENKIFPRIAVVMPDHIHFIATFSQHSDMANVIRNWKRWTARKIGIVWQDGFFDHRLRNDAELAEKMAYVANNPVRKCLCATPDDWPFRMSW